MMSRDGTVGGLDGVGEKAAGIGARVALDTFWGGKGGGGGTMKSFSTDE